MRSGRLEASHLALPLSGGLVRGFDTIVGVAGRIVGDRGHDVPMRRPIAPPRLVRQETARLLSLTLEQSPEEAARRPRVPPGLHEDIDQVTLLVHRAPQILALAIDPHEHFVQEPGIAESPVTSLQPPRVGGAELAAPLPNGSCNTMMPGSARRSSTSQSSSNLWYTRTA